MNPFESSNVIEVVGIRSIYLNKFVERRLYGIEPSLRSRGRQGSRRWFAEEDVLGIALVWWLFEAGLRTEVIKRVLREVGKSKTADAKRAAQALRTTRHEYLVIRREIRSAESKKKWPQQVVHAADRNEIGDWLSKSDQETLCVLPVRRLFAGLVSQLTKRG